MMKSKLARFAAPCLLTLTLATPMPLFAAPRLNDAPPAVALPKGVERVTSVEGITEYRLENGLKVLLFPDQSKQTITVNITYLVGSRHENYGETGMAHLLEHMVFKGTPKHPNIPKELSEHGTRPNGTTWLDRTNYFETFQATEENLKWALDLEADRMVNSYIAKKDLDSEFTVVRNEFESGENNPFRVLLQRTQSVAFDWHNYGKSTIGARADIENVPIERLQGFYRTHYQPDNAVLLVAGKFDEEKTLAMVQEYFGKIPKPARVIQKTYTLDPVQDGERMVTVRRVGDAQLVMACYHVPAATHADKPALSILAQVLGDTPSGRLHKALVETKKAAVTTGFSFDNKEPGLVNFAAFCQKSQSLDEVRDIFIKTIEGVATNPPTAEEVERMRAQLLTQIDQTLNTSDRLGLVLSEWIGAGDWRLFFLNRDRIKKVSVQDVQRVAATYLKPDNRTVGMFIPTEKPNRSEIPPTPDVAELLKDYKGGEAVAAGEVFDPSPENIDARAALPEPKGGLKMTLVPKKTRGNTVVATLTLRFGDEKSLMNKATVGELTAEMLERGTKRLNRQQIQDEFNKIKAQASFSGGPTQATFSIATTRQNLAAAMKLGAEVLREPAFPSEEFEQLKQQTITGLEQGRREPQSVAGIALRRHLSPYPKGDVRYAPTIDESVEMIKGATLDEVKKFYADFYGASAAEMAVVGDFDPKEIEGLTNDLFASWKSATPYVRIADGYRDIAGVNQSFETPDKANAVFIAGMPLNIRDDDPDYPALVLGNYMFGGGFLNSRLAVRIRQKEGISYGVGSQLSANAIDRVGRFGVFAIYAPQNVARLEAAFKEELDRAIKEGFTAEEIAAAKTGYLQSRQVSRAQDDELAARLANYRFLNRRMTWDADFEAKIKALTAEQIRAAFAKYIDPAKLSIMKAGDFAKATKQ
jgi:zinc protease